MARYLVFGRRAYAEPLAQVGELEAAGAPGVAEAGVGKDWLELVLIPADAVIWIQRDGELVRRQTEATA